MQVLQTFSDDDMPAMYRAWNKSSVDSQGAYLQVHRAVLLLMLIGAIVSSTIGVICAALDTAFAIVAAGVLVGSIVATASIRMRKQSNAWYDGRAVAESVKSIAWKYMLRAAPYGGPGQQSDNLFVQDLRKLLVDAQKGGVGSTFDADGDQLSPRMREVRLLDTAPRVAFYKDARLQDQRRWYADKAQSHENSARRWVATSIVAQLIAGVLSLVGIRWSGAVAWVGVLTTAASSALTWTQLRRHEELAHSYAFTSHELGLIATRIPSLRSDVDLAQFVSDCENAISREHTMWRARRELAEPTASV